MARKKLLECAFLIPLRRDVNLSDGRRHKRAAWRWLVDGLFDFRGATLAGGPYAGWYVDPDIGERVTDVSKKFFVAVSSDELNDLRALLNEACGVFRQKCIYLSVAGHVEFVEGPWDEPD